MSEEIYINNDYIEEPEENPEQYKKGFAITSFVLGLLSLLCCCMGLSFVLAPLSLIFGIIALVKKQGGKGLSIAGIVMSVISIIIITVASVQFSKFYPDIEYFVEHDKQIIAEYDEDGTIPERYNKYRDPKYDDLWESMGVKDFDGFFDQWVKNYKQNMNTSTSSDTSKSESSSGKSKKSSPEEEELVNIA